MPQTPPSTMLALHLSTPSTLTLNPSTPLPTPTPTQHLIHITATAPTTSELTWVETLSRSSPIPCHDLVGTIASLPTSPTSSSKYHIGDKVYGLISFSRDGCAAEYTIAEPEELSLKPSNLSDAEAASVPLSALSAWQALFVHGVMKEGDRVLVLGASGGVGVMAVQLAKAKGGVVSSTCGERNVEMVRGLGADAVFGHSSGRDVEGEFDVVIDCVGVEARREVWGRVKRGGVVVSVACPMEEGEVEEGKQGMFFIVEPNGGQLDEIGALIEEGRVKAVVDCMFGLEDGVKVFERLGRGHVRGKIVIEIAKKEGNRDV